MALGRIYPSDILRTNGMLLNVISSFDICDEVGDYLRDYKYGGNLRCFSMLTFSFIAWLSLELGDVLLLPAV